MVDGLKFVHPVHVGDVVTFRAMVNAAWRTSMEVGVRVEAEDLTSGAVTHVLSAYFTMAALDADERPKAVGNLAPKTADERRRHRNAHLRRELRLAFPTKVKQVTRARPAS
jgi:acyl-CoA hydrolase